MQTVQNICSVIGGREEQQDGYTFIQDKELGNLLCIVADGAGGHAGGGIASKIAVDAADEFFYSTISNNIDDINEELIRYCYLVHERINNISELKEGSPRTTIAGLFIKNNKAYIFHIGDSRVYRINKGKIDFRTKDHSLVQLLLDQGEIKEEEMGQHPDQSKLLKALGGEVFLQPTIAEFELEKGDGFLICTDGFWERTKKNEIESLFSRTITQERIDTIVNKAVSRNGPKSDNTTACSIQLGVYKKNQNSSLIIFILIFIATLVAVFLNMRFLGEVMHKRDNVKITPPSKA